jgi:uncharacterized membrane protein
MPKIPRHLLVGWSIATFVAAIVAAALCYLADNQFQIPRATLRDNALVIASLFVAYLLVEGFFRGREGKN